MRAAADEGANGYRVPRRRLGRTGEMVSIVGLGGYHVGIPSDERESIRIVRHAVDRGINFLDNCWDYHRGVSEERMGKALADGYRRRVFLMTKLDGRTRDVALQQLEQSLRRLRTDVIDLVQIHEVIHRSDPARVFAPGGAIEALLEARKSGKIRFIGFTGHKHPDIHLAMLRAAFEHGVTFDTVQMPLNAMDPHFASFQKNVLPVLLQRDIGVLGMKPLGGGELLKSGVVSAIECLQYAMALPTSVVITGCERVALVDQAIVAAATFRNMSKRQIADLLARTATVAANGRYELFKTSTTFDGTYENPRWLTTAQP